MKHTANRSKPTGKSKTKTLTLPKAIKKTKPAAKNSKIKIASKPIKKVVTAAKKMTAVKKAAPKLSAKTLDALKTLSVRKTNPVAKKSSPDVRVKKTETLKKPLIKTAPPKKKSTMTAAKPAVKKSAAAKTKTVKTTAKKSSVQRTKPNRTTAKRIAPVKLNTAGRQAKTAVAAKKSKKVLKPTEKPTVKKIERKKNAPNVSTGKANRKIGKIESAAKKNAAGKTKKIVSQPIVKSNANRTQKSKPAVSVRQAKKTLPQVKKAAAEKIKLIENPVVESVPAKPKNRKARPISSAVFRGVKERYDFKVFALNEKLEPIPAVYIISKRKIDRRKKGHHQLVCIGQTDSIFDELKRRRKGKCVKKFQANAISILPEADEKIRLKIETDLKAAHAVACSVE